MRFRRIKRAHLLKAIEAGRRIAAEWKSDQRQWAEMLEIMLRLRLWPRMLARMRAEGDGNAAWHHSEPPHRLRANGRPGYVLPRWNAAPTESWPMSHSPDNCWRGVARECYPSLADGLRGVLIHPEYYEDELRTRWQIEIVGETEKKEADAHEVSDIL